MNTKITAARIHPRRDNVRIRSARGVTLFRRIWGGIAWPCVPDSGAICIVGEIEPDKENEPLGTLFLLDYASSKTTDGLLKLCIDLKDLYCVSRYFLDEANEAFMRMFIKAEGLGHYSSDEDFKNRFPYFKETWLVARLEQAPQADNPEYGLQLIYDWLHGEKRRLVLEQGVEKAFLAENVFPITKEMMTSGVPPAVNALRYVLAAYEARPIFFERQSGEACISCWNDRARKTDISSY